MGEVINFSDTVNNIMEESVNNLLENRKQYKCNERNILAKTPEEL